MELKTLNTFRTLAYLKNFTKTADKLGYTQSTVTMQIQQLEQEHGVKLFDRIGKKVLLTNKGEELLHYANEMHKLEQEAIYALANERQATGTLRIGMADSLISAYFPRLLYKFNKICPGVELIISNGKAPQLMEQLDQNLLDLVYILDRPMYNKQWVKVFEKKERIVFISNKDENTSLTDKKLETILARPFIMTEKEYGYRQAFDNWLSSKNLDVKVLFEIGNTEIIKECVKNGLGYSLLPLFTVKKELSERSLYQINFESADFDIWSQLIHHKDRWLTQGMRTFILLVQQSFDY